MSIRQLLVICTVIAFTTIPALGRDGNPLDDPFNGHFAGDTVAVDLAASDGGYTGTLVIKGQSYPAKGTRSGDTLSGTFTANGSDFPFTIAISGGQISFSSGSKTVALSRGNGNLPAGDTRQAANPNAGKLPANYATINSTNFGQAVATEKPGVQSIQAALSSTLGELRGYFDGAPRIFSAYEDTRDRSIGGATFAAQYGGQAIKGWISCKLVQQGAVVAVIYCRADTPQAEWAKLLSTPAKQGGNGPNIPMRAYNFPDGTGSISLAQGWTTDAQSLMSPITIKGPANQEIVLGTTLQINTPNSMAVQTQMQLIEQARQMGMPPPNLPPMLIAPFTEPAQALQNLAPQVSQLAWQGKQIGIRWDNVQEVKKLPSTYQNGVAALLTYGLTLQNPGEQAMHYKVIDRVECWNVGVADSWCYTSYSGRSPDATFEQDLPVMLAIAGSLRENSQAVFEKGQQNVEEQKRWFAAQQKAHEEVMAAYEKKNESWRENSTRTSRSIDDFDEVIRGYRTVEDTTTGEKRQVDLGHVDQIVDKLNEYDPGRFRQIPLRDESDPLPGR